MSSDNQLRVIQICPYDLSQAGGVQHQVIAISEALMRAGHKVRIVAPVSSEPLIQTNVPIIKMGKPRRVSLWGTRIDVVLINRVQRRLFSRLVEDFFPNRIHFHTPWNPFLGVQLYPLIPKDIEKTVTFHDSAPNFGLGGLLGAPLLKIGFQLSRKFFDRGFSVSKVQATGMGAAIPDTKGFIKIVPNGLPPEAYKWDGQHCDLNNSTEGNESKSEGDYILFLARLEPRKGAEEALKVFEALKREPNLTDIRMKMVGKGPELHKLKSLASKWGLDGAVEFLSPVSESKKRTLIKGAKLLVAPAFYGESFGIVLLEAMALKTPVVGYGNPGYRELTFDYAPELFPNPGDRLALIKAANRILTDPIFRKEIVEIGFKKAQRYRWDVLIPELIS